MKTSILLILFLCALALACGGGSGSGAAPTGDQKPAPAVGQRKVEQLTQFGEKTRLCTEIVALAADNWSELRLAEGAKLSLSTLSFQFQGGLTYITSEERQGFNSFYSSPGKRAQVSHREMPFTEKISWSIFSTAGIGSFTLQRSFISAGSGSISVPAGSFPAEIFNETSDILDLNGTPTRLETKQVWRDDTRGLLKQDVTNSDGSISSLELTAFYADAAIGFTRTATSFSNGIPPSLSLEPALPGSVSDAQLREILELVQRDPVCSALAEVPSQLGHTCHLYRRYYLFPERLPTSLSGISDAAGYVAILKRSDPFTFHLTPSAFARLKELNQGERATIGFQVSNESAQVLTDAAPLLISRVLPYTRAFIDGLLAGDAITHINGRALSGLTQAQALELLPKTEATAVSLRITRSGNSLDLATAAEHQISSLKSGDIAYLNIREFSDSTPSRVLSDYQTLVAQAGKSLDKVILDLRSNGGGTAVGARGLIDLLVNADTPAQTNKIYSIQQTGQSYHLGDFSSAHLNTSLSPKRFAALMDASSASASELTLGALKHYRVATLIGSVSFGKGVSQAVIELADGGGLAITNQRLLLPSGSSYHGIGIEPDICITTPASSQSVDPQLEAAVLWVNGGTVTPSGSCTAPASKSGASRIDPQLERVLSKIN